MWLPTNSSWTSKFKWVEVARYDPSSGRVFRIQHRDKTPVLVELKDLQQYRDRYDNTGLYTSVWQYDQTDLSQTARLGSLYFDFDDEENPHHAWDEARKLYDYLRDYIPAPGLRMYFTGAKGFHVEAEAITLGIGPSNDLPDKYRYIANSLKDSLELETIDFSVYDLRRMWRLPDSRHQKTGLYKVEINPEEVQSFDDILEYAREPRFVPVPPQKFNAKANEWYREWTYKKETKSYSTQDLINRFNQFGTGITRSATEGEKEFDPVAMFENCPSTLRLWKKAEDEHDLTHDERLFLCSLLSYTEEAQEYLHFILKNCDDYDPQKSQAHIDDWIRRRELGIGGRPFTCRAANERGVGCGDCEDRMEAKPRYETIGDRLIDTGEEAEPSPIRFAYHYRKDRPRE